MRIVKNMYRIEVNGRLRSALYGSLEEAKEDFCAKIRYFDEPRTGLMGLLSNFASNSDPESVRVAICEYSYLAQQWFEGARVEMVGPNVWTGNEEGLEILESMLKESGNVTA